MMIINWKEVGVGKETGMGYRKAMTSYLIGDTVSGQPVT
jgi:hypothetical protein